MSLTLTRAWEWVRRGNSRRLIDRKSTRLNSSHSQISYAVFCLKKNNAYSFYHFEYKLGSSVNRVVALGDVLTAHSRLLSGADIVADWNGTAERLDQTTGSAPSA